MKIAIDTREATGEKTGKGWYTHHITEQLTKNSKHQFFLYNHKNVSGRGIRWHLNAIRQAKQDGVDYFFSPTSYIIPALLPKKIKAVFTVHDLIAFLFPQNHNKKATLLEKLFLKRAVRRAYKIITVSQNTKKDLQKRYKISAKKIVVTPLAADKKFKPNKSKRQKFFLAVGTIEPRKNYATLIEAFKKFHAHNSDYTLRIVGKPGWQSQKILAAAKAHPAIKLLGYQSERELQKLYNTATALVFPTLYEGFGLPILEAMSCGCPVIASNNSSIPEVAGNAAHLLENPKDLHELTAALIKLSNSPQYASKLSKKGLTQAKKFSWTKAAQQIDTLQ